jgi:peptide/nickel transport system substrate-binding protein
MQRRISRRRVLALAGAGSATALLVACGGGGSSSTAADKKPASSLVEEVADTSKQAKPGGVLRSSRTGDALTWDPHVTSSQWNGTIAAIYSRLMIIKPGNLKDSDGEVEGNVAESWEFSADRLTLTVKLRPNVTWHRIAPVNGRNVDVEDVLFSAKRLFAQGTQRAVFSNAVNPGAPITSVSSPDSRTVVFKLSFPMVSLPALLAHEFGGYFQILPKEADGGFDPRYQAIGSGPWQVSEVQPSVHLSVKKHPGYFETGRPYVDAVDQAVIPEYAAGLAQFKAGALHSYAVRPDDVLPMKRDVPELAMYQSPVASNLNAVYFGWRPSAKNPFRDVRVRQALSMTLDRDLFIDVNYNVSKLEKGGIPVERHWNSALPCNYFLGWWLDPQSRDFGPNAQYYQHNVAEAKKLLAAAGLPSGVEVVATSAPDNYGAQYAKDIEVIHGMAGDAGFKFQANVIGYNTGYQPQYRDSRGDFEGTTYRNIIGGDTDAVEALVAIYSPSAGATFVGLDADGKGTYSGDAYVDAQLLKGRSEVDINKRRDIVKDLQRHLAKQQYVVRYPGGASGVSLAWPAVRNFLAYLGPIASFRGADYYQWLDDTKPPARKA